MNCKNCGLTIIPTNNPFTDEWKHYRSAMTCRKAEPTPPESIPWPAERPWETTLGEGARDE